MPWHRHTLDPIHGQRLPDAMVEAITAASDARQDEIARRIDGRVDVLTDGAYLVGESRTGRNPCTSD